jgi:hypothetical protein
MESKKEKGRKWDGKSRVSNDLYRKNYNKIFQKPSDENAEELVHGDPFKVNVKKDSSISKKKQQKILEEIEERNGF